jgi:hypothetical protein
VESQNWQEVVALSIVALTAALLLWKKLARRPFVFHRDTGCGCCSMKSNTGTKSSIVLQGRKGEVPRITVKMK